MSRVSSQVSSQIATSHGSYRSLYESGDRIESVVREMCGEMGLCVTLPPC